MKKIFSSSVAAIAMTIAVPAMALCPIGEDAPLCETGHFVFHSANIGTGCFKVVNTDTGDMFAVQPSAFPPPVEPTGAGVLDILAQGGPLTVRSTGYKTSCGGSDQFYQIIAVRNALY